MWLLYKDGSAGLMVTPMLSRCFFELPKWMCNQYWCAPMPDREIHTISLHAASSAWEAEAICWTPLINVQSSHPLPAMCQANFLMEFLQSSLWCTLTLPYVSLSSQCFCAFGVPFEGGGGKHAVSFHSLPGYVCFTLLLMTRNPHPF